MQAAPHQTVHVSRATNGAAGDSESFRPSVSANGRFVAFSSNANNLSDVDNDNVTNVFVRDRQTNTTTLVGRASGPQGAGANSGSHSPSISGDGRLVAFNSSATNLSNGDSDAFTDVYVRDLQMNTTHLVSRASGGQGADADKNARNPSISSNGRFVAFESVADNLSPIDATGIDDIFVRDLQAGTTTLVTRGPGGAVGNAHSNNASISADGRFVAFQSGADNFSVEDNDDVSNVYVRDVITSATTFVSRANGASGVGGNFNSGSASISGDGRRVAFDSVATNLSPDANSDARRTVYVRDLQTNSTLVASREDGAAGRAANAESFDPAISADGRWVAFESFATNLTDFDHDDHADVFLRGLDTGTTSYVSRVTGVNGAGGDGTSRRASISADGRITAFSSFASNLSNADLDPSEDVFTREFPVPSPG